MDQAPLLHHDRQLAVRVVAERAHSRNPADVRLLAVEEMPVQEHVGLRRGRAVGVSRQLERLRQLLGNHREVGVERRRRRTLRIPRGERDGAQVGSGLGPDREIDLEPQLAMDVMLELERGHQNGLRSGMST
jgi:hypothetical protein